MKKEKVLKKIKSIFKKIGILFINLLKIVKRLIKKFVKFVNEFSKKDFGKVKGVYIVRIVLVLIALLFVNALIGEINSVKSVDYPIVYKTNDGKLMALKHNGETKDAIKLSGEGSANYVMYANTTNRYLLFVKNDGLYLYDSKSKEQTTKIVSNISDYYKFTSDDKYIVMKDDNSTLYVYDYSGDKQRLDVGIKNVEGLSTKNVIYTKDGSLYIKGLKASKDDKEKIVDGIFRSQVTEDGKTVYYIDSAKNLYEYNVSKKEKNQIDSLVTNMTINEEGKFYYLKKESNARSTLFHYNGKKSTKVAEGVYEILDSSAKEQQVLYLKKNNKYELYYQYKDKDADLVDGKLDSNNVTAYLFENKEIYYLNHKNELYYAKINGSKIKRSIKVLGDISSQLYKTKSGFVFMSNVNDESLGDLYIAKGYKAVKIDSNVYSSQTQIKISNSGKKIYYIKDYKNDNGTLFVSNNGGKGKQISTDVHSFEYANDKLIYYIKGYSLVNNRGDLYRYDGKSEKVATDVDAAIATMPETYK